MVILERGHKSIPYIQAGINRGLSMRAIQRSLKGTEFGVRWENLRDTVRELKGIQKKAGTIRYTAKDLRPSEKVFEKPLHRMSWKYLYQGRFEGVNRKTGKWGVETFRYGSDKIETLREVEEWVWKGVHGIYYDVEKVTTEYGYKKA